MAKRKKQRVKQYREDNREKQQQTTTCECGAVGQSKNYLRHVRTMKHQDYLKSLHTEETREAMLETSPEQ